MKRNTQARAAAVLLLAFAPAAGAAVYPAKGQSEKQQKRDADACYKWAVKESGFDPVAAGLVKEPAPAPEAGPKHAVGKGALVGTIGGALLGVPLAGAAIGAGAGAIHKSNRRKQAEQSQRQQQVDAYERAEGACMEGRGYTVR